ncbi:ribulose bisphosphate carboxylase small subunit, partial [Microcoleus anatoxicus]
LMNIADNPTNVQLPGSYDSTPLHRVPIIVTGNDFTTLYAPLIRDGRMEKFYWEPSRDDKIGVVEGIFASDQLSKADIVALVDKFAGQAIDFFSALRSRIYDEQIRQFIHTIGIEKVSKRLVNSAEEPPGFQNPNFSLAHLVEMGNLMVGQQKRIQEMRLVDEYNQSRLFNLKTPANVSADVPTQSQSNDPSSKYYKAYVAPLAEVSKSQSSRLTSEVLEQVQQLLARGCKIGMEYADNRRFKTGSWQSCATIQTAQEKEVIASVETCLAE